MQEALCVNPTARHLSRIYNELHVNAYLLCALSAVFRTCHRSFDENSNHLLLRTTVDINGWKYVVYFLILQLYIGKMRGERCTNIFTPATTTIVTSSATYNTVSLVWLWWFSWFYDYVAPLSSNHLKVLKYLAFNRASYYERDAAVSKCLCWDVELKGHPHIENSKP
jgi:hypothetical protein